MRECSNIQSGLGRTLRPMRRAGEAGHQHSNPWQEQRRTGWSPGGRVSSRPPGRNALMGREGGARRNVWGRNLLLATENTRIYLPSPKGIASPSKSSLGPDFP